MSTQWTALFLLLSAWLNSSAATEKARLSEEATRNGWLLSFGAGQEQARRTGKPLMVVLRCEP
jgi:hypothetical protein